MLKSRKSLLIRHALGAALCAALCTPLAAQDAAAPSPVERRLHEEVQAVLLRLIESGELAPTQIEEMAVTAQASQQADFGAILDVRYRADADTGLPVLGVTPNGSAAQLGVRPGDRLLAVNAVSLQGLGGDSDGRARAATKLREALLESGGEVELTVARDGTDQVLRGPVRVVDLPAYRLELGAAIGQAALAALETTTVIGDAESKCGRISTFDLAPRRRQLHRAILIAVDGNLPGPSTAEVYRLSPGKHTLTVAEAISSTHLSMRQGLHRSRLKDERYKKIEVDIQPGVTYRLAAQYHPEVRDNVREGTYWDPVLWREFPETCR